MRYTTLTVKPAYYWTMLTVLGVVLMLALTAAHRMESAGHWVTGMNNQVVWGIPHVFAILLIIAASGALNIASLGSIFGLTRYKPLSRLSGLLSIALLIGGLLVLVLDLGRPDRLIVAMTTYNFKSIFAWNIFLYTGFIVVVGIYLSTLFGASGRNHGSRVALFAMIWRFVLTTGTGCIFGFLVARDAYAAAIMAPLFVALSLSVGSAIFLLVTLLLYRMLGYGTDHEWVGKLSRLNGIFVAVVLYLVIVQYLTSAYFEKHDDVVRFFLLDGGVVTWIFWLGQIAIGSLFPMAIYLGAVSAETGWRIAAAIAVVIGSMAHLYVIIIGGQMIPLKLFPGFNVSSSFYDGVVAGYTPSIAEFALGIGGIAITSILILVGTRVLPFVPDLGYRRPKMTPEQTT